MENLQEMLVLTMERDGGFWMVVFILSWAVPLMLIGLWGILS